MKPYVITAPQERHPCGRCQTPTLESDLVVNPVDDGEFLCPKCLARTLQAIKNRATWKRNVAARKARTEQLRKERQDAIDTGKTPPRT